jgi:hypothetical protein
MLREPVEDEAYIHLDDHNLFLGRDNSNIEFWCRELPGISSIKVHREPEDRVSRVVLISRRQSGQADRDRARSMIEGFNAALRTLHQACEWLDAPIADRQRKAASRQPAIPATPSGRGALSQSYRPRGGIAQGGGSQRPTGSTSSATISTTKPRPASTIALTSISSPAGTSAAPASFEVVPRDAIAVAAAQPQRSMSREMYRPVGTDWASSDNGRPICPPAERTGIEKGRGGGN